MGVSVYPERLVPRSPWAPDLSAVALAEAEALVAAGDLGRGLGKGGSRGAVILGSSPPRLRQHPSPPSPIILHPPAGNAAATNQCNPRNPPEADKSAVPCPSAVPVPAEGGHPRLSAFICG
jgi:hypothetical protein